MSNIEYPIWAWAVFFIIVLIALAFDLGIANRRSHAPTRKETLVWSIVWISLALLFNGFVYHQFGVAKAKEFFTGYLIELSLSVDNLFVFLLIFNYFKVPAKYQHRVLFWGIFMALVLRMVMIFAGAELVEQFHWLLYFFGAFLIYTGYKMFFEDDEDFHPEESWVVRFTTRFIRISKNYEGEHFLVKIDGKHMGTLLLLVLIVINVVDLVFAVDSIPAIFGITTDRFIVYTSNIFAILGLRTFFFLLAEMAEKFHYLKYGLGFVLSFIGFKMLLPIAVEGALLITGRGSGGFSAWLEHLENHEFDQAIVNISLVIVLATLAFTIILSMMFPRNEESADQSD